MRAAACGLLPSASNSSSNFSKASLDVIGFESFSGSLSASGSGSPTDSGSGSDSDFGSGSAIALGWFSPIAMDLALGSEKE